jgi:NADPH-dependent ferric siderophore reductase
VDALYGTVLRTEQIARRMVRLVFGGDGLRSFAPTPFTDRYVNALFPPEGAPYRVPFDLDVVRTGPRDLAPRGRRETVRHWDGGARQLTIDVVTHGDEGHAGRWAGTPGRVIACRWPVRAVATRPAPTPTGACSSATSPRSPPSARLSNACRPEGAPSSWRS